MAIIYLGLGSNLGNRKKNIQKAVAALEKADIHIENISSIIETDPIDGPEQGKYLNAVLKARTIIEPQELLNLCQKIEQHLGRVKTVVNGPRTIDIDILLYDHLHLKTHRLTIPHPRMFTRDFVMQPLKEIAPEIIEEFNLCKS